MATLNLWKNFEKRKNSTKQPPGTSGSYDTLSVVLKEGTSLEQPVFIIKSNDFSYNYVQFNSTYYYVDDIVSEKNQLLELHCSRDLLATYKAKIQAASAFVLYYTHSNTEIADRRLSVAASQTTQRDSGNFAFLGTSHCYILTIVGEKQINAYCLGRSDIQNLYGQDFIDAYEDSINHLPAVTGTNFADTWISFVNWYKEWLKCAAGSFNYAGTISENIKSCKILPVTTGSVGGVPNTPVIIGGIDTGIKGYLINGRTMSDYVTVDIPWQATDWRRLSPYHEIYLYIPAVGLITLSPSDLIGKTKLTVNLTMDVLSGDAIFEVKTDGVGENGHVVYYTATNLATDFAIGSSQVTPAQITSALLGTIVGAAEGTLIQPQGALSLANSLTPTPMCIGQNTGGALLGLSNPQTVTCYTIYHAPTAAPSNPRAIQGEPFNAVMSLGSVPTNGYVQTSGASVEVGAFGNDKDIINSYLNGGIYIE